MTDPTPTGANLIRCLFVCLADHVRAWPSICEQTYQNEHTMRTVVDTQIVPCEMVQHKSATDNCQQALE